MPKRSSTPVDFITESLANVERLIGERLVEKKRKNPAAVALGRLGGKKGGKARAEALSATKRRAIAKKAAKARWGNKNSSSPKER